MSRKKTRYGGFFMAEVIVAFTIMAMLLAGLALSLTGLAKFNRYQLVRQQCIAAAQAQIDSITATGKPVPGEDFSRIWPQLSVSVNKSAGTGQWQEMELVEVTATGKSFRKQVEIQLSRYVSRNVPLTEGK